MFLLATIYLIGAAAVIALLAVDHFGWWLDEPPAVEYTFGYLEYAFGYIAMGVLICGAALSVFVLYS